MKPIKPLYVVILIIVFAGAGFYGGMLYQKNQAQASFANGGSGAGGRFGGRFGRGGGANGMMPVSGQIVSSSNNTITVKLSNGNSKIVDLSSQTKINKSTQGSVSDLTTGQQVTAFGSANSDGSITAQAVNVGNGMMMFRGQRGSQPSPTGSQ
jgi:hypothetical protein